MDSYRVKTKFNNQPLCPDVAIDFGEGEMASFNINPIAKTNERQRLIEIESLKIIMDIRRNKEYRVHFVDPYLIYDEDDGTEKTVEIKGINRVALCKALFKKPSLELSGRKVFGGILGERKKKGKEIYKTEYDTQVSKAASDINDLFSAQTGVKDDVILYYRDRDLVLINPTFRIKKH